MSRVREHIGKLTNAELWQLFDQMDAFEKTGIVPDRAQLRMIAQMYMDDNALAMTVVGQETWRELAQRGAAHTI